MAGVPNPVWLMLVLYAIGHVVLSRTTFGRYLYAVGGNRKAAWLCGVPVRRVELASYVISGALAGLAGVLMVSQYQSGAPTYGVTYELQVIAAVVVGGTSLSGGQGRMFGTLLGALLIAVVQNGMNLMEISSNPQRVVLGLVILAAAIIDRLKQGRAGE
jgi:ribose transport system permease protein